MGRGTVGARLASHRVSPPPLPAPSGFFANLTKRFFRSHEEVELSALENAIAVAVDTGALHPPLPPRAPRPLPRP